MPDSMLGVLWTFTELTAQAESHGYVPNWAGKYRIQWFLCFMSCDLLQLCDLGIFLLSWRSAKGLSSRHPERVLRGQSTAVSQRGGGWLGTSSLPYLHWDLGPVHAGAKVRLSEPHSPWPSLASMEGQEVKDLI